MIEQCTARDEYDHRGIDALELAHFLLDASPTPVHNPFAGAPDMPGIPLDVLEDTHKPEN